MTVSPTVWVITLDLALYCVTVGSRSSKYLKMPLEHALLMRVTAQTVQDCTTVLNIKGTEGFDCFGFDGGER